MRHSISCPPFRVEVRQATSAIYAGLHLAGGGRTASSRVPDTLLAQSTLFHQARRRPLVWEVLATGCVHAAGWLGMTNKLYPNAQAALADIVFDGMSLAVGGFGLCGIPEALILALRDSGKSGLTVASNNAGVDDWGLGLLLRTRQIRKMISSYVGENGEFERQFLAGELEVEFCPQGTLAERMRAGGAGIPGFYTRSGVGTQVAEGKELRQFDGVPYLLERGIVADVSLVKAWKADTSGNLIYRKTARNFNPMAATCGKITVAEAEIVVETGELEPDSIHTPGIFVHRLVHNAMPERRIERRTVREA